MANELRFSPKARIIRTIGDQMISGPVAAVIELVKNAYDADASVVTVKFVPPLTAGRGQLVVSDDGHGMTLETIEDKWMEPATDDKIVRKESPAGRSLLGSKGVGRFAAAKLGKTLSLHTVAEKASNTVLNSLVEIPKIEWDVFNETKYLSDVVISYVERETREDTGTKLSIAGLAEHWTREKLRTLHLELKRLISPIKTAGATDFQIFLDLSLCKEENAGFDGFTLVADDQTGDGSEKPFEVTALPLLTVCDYEVQGDFDEAGRFSGTMTIHRGGQKPEPVRFEVPIGNDEAECGKVLIHLYIFDRESEHVREVLGRVGYGNVTARQATRILDEISGVAVYRDDFRIRPYGDPESDWLTLDKRRIQIPAVRIGHNQMSGIIIVDSEERSGLVERSSREGFEQNPSFVRLQTLILTLLSEHVEPRRNNFRVGVGLGRRQTPSFRDAYESAQLKWISRIIKGLAEKDREAAARTAERESRKLINRISDIEKRQAALEAKSSLGLIVGEVLHEGRAPTAYLQEYSFRLLKWLPSLFDNTQKSQKHRDKLPLIFRHMYDNSQRLSRLFEMLKPLSGAKRDKPRDYSITQVLLDAAELFESRASDIGGKISVKSDPDVGNAIGFPQDLSAAVANLIDNSLFWLEHKNVENPEIEMSANHSGRDCIIEIADNGPGIPDEFKDQIFDVGFSLKPEGTGLGLSIAREALSRAGASIDLVVDSQKTRFQIKIPYGR